MLTNSNWQDTYFGGAITGWFRRDCRDCRYLHMGIVGQPRAAHHPSKVGSATEMNRQSSHKTTTSIRPTAATNYQ